MAEHPTVRHETTDANIKGILWFGIGLVALCVLCWGMVQLVYSLIESQELATKKTRFPLAKQEPPPQPRLEQINRAKPELARSIIPPTKKSELDDYRWIDEKKGIVRIPIEDAMTKLIKSGKLKARKNGKAPVAPTDSNPGRKQ